MCNELAPVVSGNWQHVHAVPKSVRGSKLCGLGARLGVLILLGLFPGCAFSIKMISHVRFAATHQGESPVRIRLLQLKKRFDSPRALDSMLFGGEGNAYPPQLETYLAADPDDNKSHTQAAYTITVPAGSDVREFKFARLKDANYLLAVALTDQRTAGQGANWVDEWEMPERWRLWHNSARVCVDTYDVFIDCEFYRLTLLPHNVSGVVKLRIFALQAPVDPGRWGWRALVGALPEELRPLLADPADFSLGAIERVQGSEEITIHHRLVRNTKAILVVLTDETESWGTVVVKPLRAEFGERSVIIDLAPQH